MDDEALLVAEPALRPAPRWRTALAARTGGLPAPFWWLWAGTLVNRAGTFIEPFFVLYLTGPRDLSVRTAGYLLTLVGVGSLVSQPIGGFLTDRFGRRATLGLSLVSTAVALAALGVVHDLAQIAVLGFLLGTVGDMYRPASTALIADVVAEPDRERAYALQFWAINLGFSVAAIAAGVLLHLGFGTLFVLDALTTLAFGVLAVRFVPETRPQHPDERVARFADPLRVLRRDRLLLAATSIVLVYAVLYGQVWVVLPLAIKHVGLSASLYGYVVAINGVLIIVVQPLVLGWLARRSRRSAQACGIALVGFGLATTAFCHSPVEFAGSVVVWTVGEILVSGSFQATIAALAPPHMRGRYAGALGLAWGASGLLAPLVGTAVFALSPKLTSVECLLAGVVAAAGQFRLVTAIERRGAATARPVPASVA